MKLVLCGTKSLLLHIVTVSLNSNVPPSNESMYPCPVKFCWLFFEPLLHVRFYFHITGIMFASLWPPWKRVWEVNIIPVMRKRNLVWKNGSNKSTEFYGTGKHALIQRWNIAIEINGDVIYRGPASFWCMIHFPVLVIIPVLKKMALLFDSYSYL